MTRTEPKSMRFTAEAEDGGKGRIRIALPFEPDEVWGAKLQHRVGGTVDGAKIRAVIAEGSGELPLGAAWVRDCAIAPGSRVKVVLWPEGPQLADLAPDVAAAFDADPGAKAFFDSLAQFYRKGYLGWIDATKRSPELRAERIAEVVALCRDGKKERTRR